MMQIASTTVPAVEPSREKERFLSCGSCSLGEVVEAVDGRDR